MNAVKRGLQKRIYVSLYAIVFLVMLLGLSILMEGCSDTCQVRNEFSYYEPVYTPLEVIREGLAIEEPRPVKAVGKIYFKDNFLFVNEPGEGIHIIDNADPANPVNKKFLKVPGNFELAIKGSVLYVDSFMDLVAIDISDINNPGEVERLEGIFSQYNSLGFYVDTERGVVTGWEENTSVTVTESACDADVQTWGGFYYEDGIAVRLSAESFNSKAAIAPGNGSGSGLGGSLARFTISNNHLYMLDGGAVQVVDITTAANPQPGSRQQVNWDIETIFPYQDKLFIGARSGMHIMDIATPETPVKISTYQHVSSCDPVVVDGDYAYVTLRSGNTCQGFDNQLEVIDIKDLQAPKLLKVYPMQNPHGLGIDGDVLFVCDGSAGLKVYNAADKLAIDQHLVARHQNIHAYDVIPFNNLLMLIGEDGIFQYNYSNPEELSLLSHIDLENEE